MLPQFLVSFDQSYTEVAILYQRMVQYYTTLAVVKGDSFLGTWIAFGALLFTALGREYSEG